MWFKGNGILLYDPPRPGMKRKIDWWCVIKTDNEICRYYRYWVEKNPVFFGETRIDLNPPSWGGHVSVIRGEIPRQNKKLWKKYHGEKINFEYSHQVRRSGDTTNDQPEHFFFVKVRCLRLTEIREEFGLPMYDTHGHNYTYHMTIGRIN